MLKLKRILLLLLFASVAILSLQGCGKEQKKVVDKNTLTVFNPGEYMDPDVIKQFEKETGIHVIYEEFDTNEIMYTKATVPNATYDVICPSDYMIQRMMNENRLLKIDKSKLTNYNQLIPRVLDLTKSFDPKEEYSIPYAYGTVGILYNDKYVSADEVKSWNVLWNEKYSDEILMPDSVRDIMAVALKRRRHSLNTSNENELMQAEQDLIAQKPLVQAYVNDQVRDKMISEEAQLGVIYSGEALFAQGYNEHLQYSVPEEGSNVWIDCWVIPKSCHNVENALKWIDFMLRPDIACKNYEYLTYSTPNQGALDLTEDEELKTSEVVIPSEETLKRCETMKSLPPALNRKYNEIFMRVKTE